MFLTTGRSLELSVATVNLSLSCSYIPENVTWLHPPGDRISISDGNTLMISILRLAESGNYTCQNSYTGEEVKIELIPTGEVLKIYTSLHPIFVVLLILIETNFTIGNR